tara:strand:+ start:3880 stop:5091 length:1212 start_codon:yes stop_codon:yes gene_type:complete
MELTKRDYDLPDSKGHFAEFGGRFVPETLIPALDSLEEQYLAAKENKLFNNELSQLLKYYCGRETPLYKAEEISKELGFNLWLKREDLNHTGAHKINNALGQILLAKKMGKKRIIAETGAGQHGVATAAVAAKFGFECIVYMGEEDIERQKLNVFRMNLMGAEIRPVSSGSKTLKDATNEAIRDWVSNVENTFYIIGSSVGPHPYPMLVRDFQSVIGKEAIIQFKELTGLPLPDKLIACVGGGSNALGLFYPFLPYDVEIIGVEAGGKGLNTTQHAATLTKGEFGVLHGAASMMLQNEDGQVTLPHSISAGLDYPGIGPEHSYLSKSKRVKYKTATDDEALDAFKWMSEKEGIIPALETAHAIAYLKQKDNGISKNEHVILNLSGRGDKDVSTVEQSMKKKYE